MIENVKLRDVHLDVVEIEDPTTAILGSRSMQTSNFNPKTRAVRAAIVADNVNGLALDDVSVSWPADSAVPMHALARRRVQNLRMNSPLLVPTRGAQPEQLID
jgi:hypothetical protein